MSDFVRTKFEWGFRDIYKHGNGTLEYVKARNEYTATWDAMSDGLIFEKVSSVREGRAIIRKLTGKEANQ